MLTPEGQTTWPGSALSPCSQCTTVNPRRERIHFRPLSYRAAPDEVGPAKGFDFSRATIGDRWREGGGDMQRALRELRESSDERPTGLAVHKIPAGVR